MGLFRKSTGDPKPKGVWGRMWERLVVAFPLWVMARMDAPNDGKGIATKAIPFVIAFLSVASIANLSARAYEHHANLSSYMTGAGIAVLVPIAVVAAMIIEGRWSFAFWAMAVVFAGISGTIQYSIYVLPGIEGWQGEAIAFGYGVPLSEVMLAVMEARLIIQMERKKQNDLRIQAEAVAAQALAEKLERDAIAEQQRQDAIADEEREFARQKRQADLDAYRAQLTQDAEIKREETLTKLRIKETVAGAKLGVKNDVKSGVKSGDDFTPATGGGDVKFDTSAPKKLKQNKTQARRSSLLDILGEINGQGIEALVKSDVARRLNTSRPTLDTDLDALVNAGELSLNGHVRVRRGGNELA